MSARGDLVCNYPTKYRCCDEAQGGVKRCSIPKEAQTHAQSQPQGLRALQQNGESNRKRALSSVTSSSRTIEPSCKKQKTAYDAIGLINRIKDWEHLSNDDFFDKRSRLLELLELENDRRCKFPDDSYARGSGRRPRLNYYPLKGTLQQYTDWQFHYFAEFWSQEIRRLGELKKEAVERA